jgi:hypothetical protein
MDIDENAAPKIQKYSSNRKSGIIAQHQSADHPYALHIASHKDYQYEGRSIRAYSFT